MDNPLPTPIGPFWTPPNYPSLINKILLHTGGERTAAMACSMYAINLCRKIFDDHFGADTKLEGSPASSDEPEAGKNCDPVPDVSALPTDDTPDWQDKAKQQGGNLVGSGFVQAVISGEERLEQDEAEALHPAQPAQIEDAVMYESTLDTLVEWFGGEVPSETYRKLREGADEVAKWIEANKGTNQ